MILQHSLASQCQLLVSGFRAAVAKYCLMLLIVRVCMLLDLHVSLICLSNVIVLSRVTPSTLICSFGDSTVFDSECEIVGVALFVVYYKFSLFSFNFN